MYVVQIAFFSLGTAMVLMFYWKALHKSVQSRLRTKLIVFLGTPHRGSSSADWGQLATNMANMALLDTNEKIIKTLRVDSEVLENIHNEFKDIVTVKDSAIKIHSFFEGRGVSGMKGISGKVRKWPR